MRETLWYGSAVAIGTLAAILWGMVRKRRIKRQDHDRLMTKDEYDRRNNGRTP